MVISIVILFLMAIGIVWIRTSTVRATYLYVQQEKQLRKLEQEILRAKVSWLRMTTPEYLDRMAKNFGLFPASVDQVLKYPVN